MAKTDMVVEVRFDCQIDDLTESQVFGLLREFTDREISVGLGYGGVAAVVVLDVLPSEAEDLIEKLVFKARSLGLIVLLSEALDTEQYNARAIGEMEL